MSFRRLVGGWSSAILALILGAALPAPSAAEMIDLIENGGLSNGLAGWTVADQTGSGGTFQLQSGTLSPQSMIPVPAPEVGTMALMFDPLGPATSVAYQDLTIPTAKILSATLVFHLFIANHSEDFASPPTLNYEDPRPNQQFRTDFLNGNGDPFSVDSSDVLLNLYRTEPGDPLIFPSYLTLTFDVTDFLQGQAGQTIRLRFAAVANFDFMIGSFNAVSLKTEVVPEPGGLVLLGIGGSCVLLASSSRRPGGTAARSPTRLPS